MPRKLVPQRYVVGSFAASQAAATIVAAWRRILADDDLHAPLDLPGLLLSAYFRERNRSRLGKLLTAAKRLAETCDPVVLVGSGCAMGGAAALFAATTHPFYNQLGHGGRGGRPRLLLVEPTLDNDRLQAAFDLLKPGDDAHSPGDKWGLVVAGDVEETASVFLAALRESASSDESYKARLVELDAMWLQSHYCGGLALVAAALVGADVVSLLKGAAWFHEAAKKAVPAACEAVRLADFVAGGPTAFIAWHHALEAPARRFDPNVAVVAGCDPAERQSLSADNRIRRIHLTSDVVRRDRLPGLSPASVAYQGIRDAEAAAEIASCEIRLTKLNDHAVGELCAWLDAARLIGKLAQSEA
jgi:hypothetical protein